MPVRKGIELSKKDAAAFDKLQKELEYNDNLQYIYKIKMNSLYGALSNTHFRFFDWNMASSVTATGQRVLKHMGAKVNEVLCDEYYFNEDDSTLNKAVVYGDTDSIYFSTQCDNVEDAREVGDGIATVINKSFPAFMQDYFMCQPGYDKLIQCGREVISDRGIFIDKKRYILHVVDNEGEVVDKMKIMGVELKKTILPKPIAKQLTQFIEDLLKGKSWDKIAEEIVNYKSELKTTDDIMSIGLPKGVQKVEVYQEMLDLEGEGARVPGHTRAALFWNKSCDTYEDHESLRIASGNKIRLFYLTKVDGRNKSIAVPGDIDELPTWFVEQYVPHIDRNAQIERLVDNPLQNILRAINIEVPSEQSFLFDSLFD
jgi:DNA polymerase elongation subunit (family B)